MREAIKRENISMDEVRITGKLRYFRIGKIAFRWTSVYSEHLRRSKLCLRKLRKSTRRSRASVSKGHPSGLTQVKYLKDIVAHRVK